MGSQEVKTAPKVWLRQQEKKKKKKEEVNLIGSFFAPDSNKEIDKERVERRKTDLVVVSRKEEDINIQNNIQTTT